MQPQAYVGSLYEGVNARAGNHVVFVTGPSDDVGQLKGEACTCHGGKDDRQKRSHTAQKMRYTI